MQPIRDLALKGDDTILCSCKLHVNGNQVCQTPFWIGYLDAGRQEVPLTHFSFHQIYPVGALPGLSLGRKCVLSHRWSVLSRYCHFCSTLSLVMEKKGLFSEQLQVSRVVEFPFLQIFKSHLNMVCSTCCHLDLLEWDQIISRGHLPHNLNHSVMLWCATSTQAPAEGSVVLSYRKKAARTELPLEQQSAFVCHTYATQQGNSVFAPNLSYGLNTCINLGFTGVLACHRLFLKQSRSHFRHCLGAAPASTLCLVITLPEHLQAGLLHTWHQRGCKPSHLRS